VTFTLVFAAFHTFFCLIGQEDQIRCFANVAARLPPGGRFVIDAFVPELGSFVVGQRVRVAGLTEDCLSLAATLHDPLEQRIRTQCVFVLADGGSAWRPGTSVTPGRPSSISWPASPASSSSTNGRTSRGRR